MLTLMQITQINAEASSHFYLCIPMWAADVLKLTFETNKWPFWAADY